MLFADNIICATVSHDFMSFTILEPGEDLVNTYPRLQ